MIGLQSIESALVQVLSAAGLPYEVQPYPEKSSEFRFTHPNGVVLVRFRKSTFEHPHPIDSVVQDVTVQFDCAVLGRSLRGAKGAYVVTDGVRNALSGIMLETAPVYPVSEEFMEEEDGVWTFSLSYAVPLTHVQALTTAVEPLLTRITTSDNFGTTEEIP
jgi:hypothetical protein